MTLLNRVITKNRKIKNDINVGVKETHPYQVYLGMISRDPRYNTLSVSLTLEEVDDLIVMLQYYRREASNAIEEKQAGKDPD